MISSTFKLDQHFSPSNTLAFISKYDDQGDGKINFNFHMMICLLKLILEGEEERETETERNINLREKH